MQPDLVDEPRQMHPTTHCLARAAGINDVAHANRIVGLTALVNGVRRSFV
jgi:hypothetical protein